MNNVSLPVNRIYKDRLYKMIFNDKSELLKLYNAINGTADVVGAAAVCQRRAARHSGAARGVPVGHGRHGAVPAV